LVDEGRVVDVVRLDFSKTVDSVCHNMITKKLMKHGLHNWTVVD